MSIRIGNCSGFYGDRLGAMREMLTGGELDYLTGDYLAELTMLILGKDTMKDPDLGYARTFVRQAEDCLGLALERGVRIVTNAGGLNPAGLAAKLREVASGLGLEPAIAHVEGDDVRDLADQYPELKGALTANAYLGGFGIAAALRAGADIVVTGRVTDASVVVGPAVSAHGWGPGDHDELAGAVVAGHIIECGTQATGGNFSGFKSLPHRGIPLGFPIAEVDADGSSVITKHDDTGGAVTVDTVTAQLLYEIQSTRYLNPDATALLDSIELSQEGADRVRVAPVHGEAPPERLKVCVNELGGWRNNAEFVLTGLDIDAKADWLRSQLTPQLIAGEVTWSMSSRPTADSETQEGASAVLRVSVTDPDQKKVAKAFTGPAVELALASYPGLTLTGPPAAPTPFGLYRPEYLPRDAVEHTVVHPDGRREVIEDPAELSHPDAVDPHDDEPASVRMARSDPAAERRMPLGAFVHARSGDKGGDANLGLWVTHEGDPTLYEPRVAWLLATITEERIVDLIPEAEPLDIEIHPLPNLGAVNVLLRGLLGKGVAASTRFDPQAKAVGEWVRSRTVSIPEELL